MGCLGGSVCWASDFSSGHDLTDPEFEPHVGLCADSSEPGACFGFCVFLSLCPSSAHALSLSKIFKFFFNVYLFLIQRETEHEWERARKRGRHRIRNRLQALNCQHRARRGARTHRPQDHDPSQRRTPNRLSHPSAPGCSFLKMLIRGVPGWLSPLSI